MKAKKTKSTLKNKNIVRVLIAVVIILLVPLVLTLINPNASINGGAGGGWDWGPLDFVAAFVLLFGTGLTIDFTARKITNPVYRVFAIFAIVVTFLAVWVEIAVDAVSQGLHYVLR